jgi:hypothetical protein
VTPRIFLLSPANCGGIRARLLLSDRARFPLARRLREGEGAALGDVMSFVSGLYFRGKLAYARAFARPPDPACEVAAGGVLVITPDAGLQPSTLPVTLTALRGSARVDIRADNPRYRRPLQRSAERLAARLGPACEVVLLGSIASAKYVDVLTGVFGDRLRFPLEFVGRGDMSRGGLMLRCVADGRELTYVRLGEATRHGPRPPKLPPLPRRAAELS